VDEIISVQLEPIAQAPLATEQILQTRRLVKCVGMVEPLMFVLVVREPVPRVMEQVLATLKHVKVVG